MTTTTTAAPASCRFFFGRERKCKFGDQCRFSHDEDQFLAEHQLKRCGNAAFCPGYCRGDFCRECRLQHYLATTQPCLNESRGCTGRINPDYALAGLCQDCYRQKKETRTGRRETRPCQGFQCKAETVYRFCPDCKEANDRYHL